MTYASVSRGVYFLANDRIFDLTVAFLNSFRKYNPEIPLCLIPFNADIERIAALQSIYGFSVFSDGNVLESCDAIGARFHGRPQGEYRKLAMWEGGFDEFIYIDVDTVVLTNIDFVFPFLSEYDFVTSHSNIPEIVKWVWKKSVYDSRQLTAGQIAYSANTGFIASKKEALSLEGIKNKVEPATVLSPHMNFFCKEQAFLNYVIVTSGKKYTSLHVLKISGIHPDIKTEHWAGLKHGVIKNGQIYFNNKPGSVLLLHWAGNWHPKRLDRVIYRLQVLLRLKKKEDEPVISRFMSYKKLWKYYRFLRKETAGK
jgi:hypothetical protein